MKSAIILHGMPSKQEYYDSNFPSASNSHWIPWLQKQLLVNGFSVQTPEMPNSWKPDYEIWRREFERFDITPQTVLVGHSCGGGFLVRWLGEHPRIKVGRVVLVAPSLGLDWEDRSFFDFTITPNVAEQTSRLVIIGSDNDKPAVLQAIEKYRAAIRGVQYRELVGRGHFTRQSMGTEAFPELLNELVG